MHRLCDDSEGKNFQRSKHGKSDKMVARSVIQGVGFAERGLISFILFTCFASGKDVLCLKCWLAGSALFPFS